MTNPFIKYMLLSQNFGSDISMPTLLTNFSGDNVLPEDNKFTYFGMKAFPSDLYFAKSPWTKSSPNE